MKDWNASFKAAAAGTISGTAVGLIAFWFLTSKEYPGMGAALFLLVPVVAGFSIALLTSTPNTRVAAALLSVLGSLVLLIALGKEGVLCAVLAFPIIVAGLVIGAGIGILVRKLVGRLSNNQTTTTAVLLLVGPTLIFAGDQIERPILKHPRAEIVQTTIPVNGPPNEVWDRILSIDNVEASKPLLMYVGLPVPLRCVMQGRGVGAKRTCYFNVGYIQETVTAWNPSHYLGLSIDRTHMPGRHWLGFEAAEYSLRQDGRSTLLTRTTTISSHLHPSWYWRRFERLGVESEHNYILQDLAAGAAK